MVKALSLNFKICFFLFKKTVPNALQPFFFKGPVGQRPDKMTDYSWFWSTFSPIDGREIDIAQPHKNDCKNGQFKQKSRDWF